MDGNVVNNLCSLPATDLNFTSELNRATAYQIKQAIETMKQNGGKNKGRIKACDRELENRRLTKKGKDGKYVSKEHLSILCNTFSSEHRLKAILNKLGEYEDTERQGLLLRLPISEDAPVYSIEYCCGKNKSNRSGMCFRGFCENCSDKAYYIRESVAKQCSICEINKSVFFTREETETKLKEMEENQ